MRHRINAAVETGTYLGDTASMLRLLVRQVYTIEISPELAKRARVRFRHSRRVTVLEGDSGDVLPGLVGHLPPRTLFWLDGHYSWGITSRGRTDTPIREELATILAIPEERHHILLIDDVRDFGSGDYPAIEEIQRAILAAWPGYRVTIEDDILRALPAR